MDPLLRYRFSWSLLSLEDEDDRRQLTTSKDNDKKGSSPKQYLEEEPILCQVSNMSDCDMDIEEDKLTPEEQTTATQPQVFSNHL